jgi:serine/threonine protein kinase
MEGAETTAENLLLDLRKSGGSIPKDHLKSIAISLLHIHDRGLVHGDFGTHNVAKFGDRWKILGIGGTIEIGQKTNPKRGFFHPPEAVVLETRNVSLGEKNVGAAVVSIDSAPTYDVWAFGTIIYEALAGLPLSPYRSAYKAKRAMTTAELFKVGQWDDRSLRKALRHINDENAQDLIKKLLHPSPESRAQSMREVLEHSYFGLEKLEKSTVFEKLSSAKEAEQATLKIYSDKYMAEKGWTDADVAELFTPKEAYVIESTAIAEEDGDEEALNPAEDDEPEMQEAPSRDDSIPSIEQRASSYEEFVTLMNSPARSTTAVSNEPAEPAAQESPEVRTATISAPKPVQAIAQVQPQSTPAPPPPPPISTPQTEPTAKSKSKFSVKGLKSKFSKK